MNKSHPSSPGASRGPEKQHEIWVPAGAAMTSLGMLRAFKEPVNPHGTTMAQTMRVGAHDDTD